MSYKTALIGDLFPRVSIGGTPSRGSQRFFGGPHVWVSIRDMNGKMVIHDSFERLTDDGVKNSNCKLIRKGSLLFSFKLTVGRVAKAGVDLYTNEAIAAFDVEDAKNANIDLDYLALVLPAIAQADPTKNSMGAALLNKQKIARLKIPVPSIAEQRHIATSMTAQLAAVEEARQAAQAQLRDLKTLAIRLNEETITKLNSFKSVTLGELIKGIETGKSFQTSERIASVNELGVLKVSAISWGAFNPQAAKAIDGAYTPDEKHRVCAGDVIITRANTVELVGAVVRVEHDYPNRLLSDKTLRLLLDTNRCDADYIVQVLRLPEARAHLEGNATGSSNSMRNISQGTLRATPIPLPPLHEQQQFSKNMLEVENALNGMRTTIQQQLRDIELLPSRLLAQAFDTQ